jgi:membrane fusion protein (multidrug efflux system)
MSARTSEQKSGDAEIVPLPKSEKAAPAEPAPAPKKRNGRRILLLASVPVLVAAVGGYFWLTGGRYQETDNAYVEQAKVALSADVAGRILSVTVHENEAVQAGDILFTLDPEPYSIALAQSDAALATARVNVEQLKVAYRTSTTQLDASQSTLAIRQSAFDRKNALVEGGNASDATLDDVKLALETARNAVASAEQQVASARAALTGDPDIAIDAHPAVRAALAARDTAARNLDKTTVRAPADGIVSQVANLNPGQFIATGSTIASLIETGNTWIEANFKETQLAALHEGMKVEIKIDAFPGVAFEGELESIAAATGSEFALVPAQNATGNWVKIIQRVPVRIAVHPVDGKTLRAGMSAVVAVDIKAAS